MKSGFGVLKSQNFTYTGDFVDDKKTGKGFILFNNGAQYKGQFR